MGKAFNSLPDPKPFIINIDHHVTNTQFGDINLVEPKATSTTEILYQLFIDMGIVISPEIAHVAYSQGLSQTHWASAQSA